MKAVLLLIALVGSPVSFAAVKTTVTVAAQVEDASFLIENAGSLNPACQVQSPDLRNVSYDVTTGLARLHFEISSKRDASLVENCVAKLVSDAQALGYASSIQR